MAGIFSKFSGRKFGHQRSQSTVDARETLQTNLDTASSLPAAAARAIEMENDFKMIEQPTEPLSQDSLSDAHSQNPQYSMQAPPKDGRIWKARMSSVNTRVRAELPVVKDGPHLGSEAGEPKPAPATQKRMLPSLSAPERTFLTLL